LGVKITEENLSYVEAVGSRWLISAVARIMNPGAKADCCLILEGPQGITKSTALRILASPEWFTDSIPSLEHKDSAIQLLGKLIAEFSELDRLSRSEVTLVKSYVSRAVDRFRPPYGTRASDFGRQCIFAGTVNKAAYLADETGARRFWPLPATRSTSTPSRRTVTSFSRKPWSCTATAPPGGLTRSSLTGRLRPSNSTATKAMLGKSRFESG
jgi:predicted P-loop ATPase